MVQREQFSSLVDSVVLAKMREIAATVGKEFDEVVQDAMLLYVARQRSQGLRPEVMGHFWASVEKNRDLIELLAQYESRSCDR